MLSTVERAEEDEEMRKRECKEEAGEREAGAVKL